MAAVAGCVFQLNPNADNEYGTRDKTTMGIDDVPIFLSDEEKIEFESTLNVDLSCIDHMFKVSVGDLGAEKGGCVKEYA